MKGAQKCDDENVSKCGKVQNFSKDLMRKFSYANCEKAAKVHFFPLLGKGGEKGGSSPVGSWKPASSFFPCPTPPFFRLPETETPYSGCSLRKAFSFAFLCLFLAFYLFARLSGLSTYVGFCVCLHVFLSRSECLSVSLSAWRRPPSGFCCWVVFWSLCPPARDIELFPAAAVDDADIVILDQHLVRRTEPQFHHQRPLWPHNHIAMVHLPLFWGSL